MPHWITNPVPLLVIPGLRWGLRRLGLGMVLVGMGALVGSFALPAEAATWYLVGEAGQGQQQYVDLDSVVTLGPTIQVRSLYISRPTDAPAPATTSTEVLYLTEYDCQRRLFRDVQRNGQPLEPQWFGVQGDPLNGATLDYVCALPAGLKSGQAQFSQP